jgi:serine/threonine-protein kinase
LSEIGTGATATVYLAEDRVLHRKVAIKRLHPHLHDKLEAVHRFEKEAVAVAALDHENIIQVFDFGRNGKSLYLAMPYVEGASLDQWLAAARGPLPNLAVIGLFRQILSGLAAAHDRGVYHRDIKPSNVLIDGEGRVRIADFGIAYLAEAPAITRTASFLGTPGYAAPEQAQGKPVCARTDVFSAGSVLYQCLTGRPPFEGDTPHAVLIAILQREPAKAHVANRKALPDLAELAQAMLAKSPQDRPDARACLRRLEGIEAALGLSAGPERIRSAWADPEKARAAEEAELSERFAVRARRAAAEGRRREALKSFALAEAFAAEGSAPAREASAFARREARRARVRLAACAALLLALSVPAGLRLKAWSERVPPRPSLAPSPPVPRPKDPSGEAASRPLPAEALPAAVPAGPPANGQSAAGPGPSAAKGPVAPMARGPALPARRREAAAPAASPGWLLVKSNPPFAQLRVDDAEGGRTPTMSPLRLPAGLHRLDLRRDGCLPLRAEALIRPGETTAVRLSLARDTAFHP